MKMFVNIGQDESQQRNYLHYTLRFFCDITILWTTEWIFFWTYIFRKLMIWQWWQSPFVFNSFLLCFSHKILTLRIDSVASNGGPKEANIFHALVLDSAWGRTVDFNFFFFLINRGRKLLFLTYPSRLTCSAPKEIPQHQTLVCILFMFIKIRKLQFCFIKYFTLPTCELFSWVQLVMLNLTGVKLNDVQATKALF